VIDSSARPLEIFQKAIDRGGERRPAMKTTDRNETFHRVLRSGFAFWLSLAFLPRAGAEAASTPAQSCEVAKLNASSSFALCRSRADSRYAMSADASAREAAYAKCEDWIVRAYGRAEYKYGTACPTKGDVRDVMAYLGQCTTDVDRGTKPGGTMPDRLGDLVACTADLESCDADLASCAGGLPLAPLLETGQRVSRGAGSDGDLRKGVSRSFSDNGDGTMTDLRTGLTWEKKSDDGSIHDADDRYTWGVSMTGTMVTAFLASLNTPPCFAGHCDWRIPNRNELVSLVDLGSYGPATFPAFDDACTPGCTVTTCSCTRNGSYWTSTTMPDRTWYAWGVAFYDGGFDGNDKAWTSHVRAVRGGS